MNLLEIKELKVDYTTKSGVSGETKLVHAINGINLGVRRGEILAVAGESGCGKSTLAKAIMKLVDIKNGEIIFQGTNSTALNSIKEIRQFYQKVQMVFQNPYSSLNPKMKIGSILKEPLLINKKLSSQEITRIVEEKNITSRAGYKRFRQISSRIFRRTKAENCDCTCTDFRT
jgi:ABC-type glutathione transport system ATPase component